ncbi:hypothetical protein [Chamaesiphon minutus]|uniref:hypothetical protein n=1 Tax=Chamaesiphon minutus TaxID=1173032 RepID=UPI00031E353D|nr:hypothetical protein [Chamaesiphon minutus]
MKKDKISTRGIILSTVLIALVSGCRSNDDYNKLGMAGSKYIDAVNLLLEEAADTRINLSSEQILANDRGTVSINDAEYNKFSNSDREGLKEINRIIEHNLLLKRYFSLLQELANSDAPQKAEAEIERVAENLIQLGKVIDGDGTTTTASSTLGSGVNFIVKLQIRAALKQELEKRGKLISNELKIQEEALQKINSRLLQQKRLLSQLQENRLVVRSITASIPIGNEDGWIAIRQKVIKTNVMSEKFNNASLALSDFRKIFESFLEGKSDLAAINNFLVEVESFTKLISERK